MHACAITYAHYEIAYMHYVIYDTITHIPYNHTYILPKKLKNFNFQCPQKIEMI